MSGGYPIPTIYYGHIARKLESLGKKELASKMYECELMRVIEDSGDFGCDSYLQEAYLLVKLGVYNEEDAFRNAFEKILHSLNTEGLSCLGSIYFSFDEILENIVSEARRLGMEEYMDKIRNTVIERARTVDRKKIDEMGHTIEDVESLFEMYMKGIE